MAFKINFGVGRYDSSCNTFVLRYRIQCTVLPCDAAAITRIGLYGTAICLYLQPEFSAELLIVADGEYLSSVVT